MYFGVTDVENRLTVHDNAAQVLPGVEADKPTPAAQVSDTMRRPVALAAISHGRRRSAVAGRHRIFS